MPDINVIAEAAFIITSSLSLPIKFNARRLPTVIDKALIPKKKPKFSILVLNCSMITNGEVEKKANCVENPSEQATQPIMKLLVESNFLYSVKPVSESP